MKDILKVVNLSLSYGPIKALKSINMHVSQGEVVAVVGANGVGKSSLMRAISNTVKAKQGEIIFDGVSIANVRTHKLVRQGLVHVSEGRGTLTKNLTVKENLLTAFEARRSTSVSSFETAVSEVYQLFPRLKERLTQMAGNLSGGEQQMLVIAKSIMIRPKLLMLDEPSLGLSPLFVKEIFRIIKSLGEEGISILLVEQNARIALKVAQRGYVLSNGEVVMEGLGLEILENNQILSAYLGG